MASTTKRVRIEPNDTLREMKEMFDRRLNALERKIEFLINTCTTILGSCDVHKKSHTNSCCAQLLLPKINFIDNYIKNVKNSGNITDNKIESTTPILFVPSVTKSNEEPQIIELNSEQDMPNGSWLGDQDNPKSRVRVRISPEKLKEINEMCLTPEKMALTLLDFLFPREVLAVSNLSGKGKHSKKQLDPLLIYAIRCHLAYKFNITDQDWHRIKQNLDSKCRTIWKKNNMGLPLNSNNNNSKNEKDLDNNANHFSQEFERANNLSSSGCYRRSAESRSNSPLKNISTLPSIMEEESDYSEFSDDKYIHLLQPNLHIDVDESDCFNLDTKPDPDLIPDKLFDDGILDCHIDS